MAGTLHTRTPRTSALRSGFDLLKSVLAVVLLGEVVEPAGRPADHPGRAVRPAVAGERR